MTREEAKSLLQPAKIMLMGKDNQPISDLYYALEMAIQALSQEPCDDAVSREAVIDAIERVRNNHAYDEIEEIQKLPSVTPTQKNTLENTLDDAISRQAVIESIKNLYPDMPVMDIMGARRKWLEKYAPYFECENAVEHLPSVRPQEHTGHWIDTDNYYQRWKCSECHCHTRDAQPHYCPNCGARMESEDKK